MTPSTTFFNFQISIGNNKNVPLKLKVENGSSNQKYELTSDTEKVKVFGTKKELESIDKVVAYVDVSGITSKKVVNVELDKNLNNVTGFDPENIKVTVIPQ